MAVLFIGRLFIGWREIVFEIIIVLSRDENVPNWNKRFSVHN